MNHEAAEVKPKSKAHRGVFAECVGKTAAEEIAGGPYPTISSP